MAFTMAFTKKAERTKGRLLNAAKELISERGFEKVSVEDITRKAGVAKGTFYHYFEAKENVVQELTFSKLLELFTATMEMEGSPEKKLSHYFMELLHEAEWMGVNLLRQWLRSVSDPKMIENSTARFEDGYRRIYAILQQGIDEGYLIKDTPVDLLTKLFLSHFTGALATWCILDAKFSLSKEAGPLVKEDIESVLKKYAASSVSPKS